MMKKVLICVLFALSFGACTIRHNNQALLSNRMACHYYNRRIEMPFSAGCFMPMNDTSSSLDADYAVNDTVLIDAILLDSISRLVSSLQKVEENGFGNACVVCMLEYHGKKTLICIDWFSDILINHQPMMRNDTLSFFLKKNIGFYRYFTPENGYLLEWFPEYKQLMKQNNDP